jgi:GTP cyclohydrolase II
MPLTLSKVETIDFPTEFGKFQLTTYDTHYPEEPDMRYVLTLQTNPLPIVPLVRVHSSCIFSEVFSSQLCDCQQQLESSLQLIAKEGGLLFYLDQEGRGHGIHNKTLEIKLQQEGLDTLEASEKLQLPVDSRKYTAVTDILKFMKINTVDLLTNNPDKIQALQEGGVKIRYQKTIQIEPNEFNKKYLETKKIKLKHISPR